MLKILIDFLTQKIVTFDQFLRNFFELEKKNEFKQERAIIREEFQSEMDSTVSTETIMSVNNIDINNFKNIMMKKNNFFNNSDSEIKNDPEIKTLSFRKKIDSDEKKNDEKEDLVEHQFELEEKPQEDINIEKSKIKTENPIDKKNPKEKKQDNNKSFSSSQNTPNRKIKPNIKSKLTPKSPKPELLTISIDLSKTKKK